MFYKNIFNLKRFNFPLNIDLLFKLLAIVVIFNPYVYQTLPQLPFIDFFNTIKDPLPIRYGLNIITAISIILILFNVTPRLGTLCLWLSMSITIA